MFIAIIELQLINNELTLYFKETIYKYIKSMVFNSTLFL